MTGTAAYGPGQLTEVQIHLLRALHKAVEGTEPAIVIDELSRNGKKLAAGLHDLIVSLVPSPEIYEIKVGVWGSGKKAALRAIEDLRAEGFAVYDKTLKEAECQFSSEKRTLKVKVMRIRHLPGLQKQATTAELFKAISMVGGKTLPADAAIALRKVMKKQPVGRDSVLVLSEPFRFSGASGKYLFCLSHDTCYDGGEEEPTQKLTFQYMHGEEPLTKLQLDGVDVDRWVAFLVDE